MGQKNYIKIIYTLIVIIIIESAFLFALFQKKEKVLVVEKKEKAARRAKPEKYKCIGRIAIVLDDWGYNLNNLEAIKELKEPLTLAILPRRAYSAQIAKAAKDYNKEAILHLPLEPHQESKYHLEPDTILANMSRRQILKILELDIKSVPYIKGVSNHMGSFATENEPLMKIIFDELKKKGLYFLDSFTGKTVCRDLAEGMNLPYARRHVFLDNKSDAEYILAQVEVLAKIARQEGSAIGIGHDRTKTLEVLIKAIPDLKKRGFKFVRVSELVE